MRRRLTQAWVRNSTVTRIAAESPISDVFTVQMLRMQNTERMKKCRGIPKTGNEERSIAENHETSKGQGHGFAFKERVVW